MKYEGKNNSIFEVKVLRGLELEPYLNDIGNLRIQVFREWPYLYEGNLEYEKNYLKTYTQAKNSFVALCCFKGQVIGATTAIDLLEEEDSFQKPFKEHSYKIEDVVYFGESILLKNYRGHGIGQLFMKLRLEYAKSFANKKIASFCAVIRPPHHPLKPSDYRPLDEFWMKNGFAKVPGMLTSYSWKDLDQKEETKKEMQFWIKQL